MSESNDENTITENTTTESSTTENTTAENENNTENNTENNSENILNIIFSETNVTIVLWFLAIYIVISVALGIFDGSKDMNQLSTFVKTVDFAILLIVVGYCLYSYYSLIKFSLIGNKFFILFNFNKEPVFIFTSKKEGPLQFKNFFKVFSI